MTRARELANFADNTAGLETLTVSDITDLSVSASNINSATNQITDSSTDLNVDSNTLVVDKSENRVGIGTATPETELDMGAGKIRLDNTKFIYWDDAGGTLRNAIRRNSNEMEYWSHPTDSGGQGTHQFKVGDTGGSTIDALKIDSSGNVGIGTTSPATDLDTQGLQIRSDQFWYTGGALRFVDKNGGTNERMRIDSSGNVGIGTNTITEKIEVNGSINTKYQSLNFATGAKRGFFDCYAGGNQVRFGATSGAGTDGMDLLFYTTASGATGTTERMRIDSSGALMLSAGVYFATKRASNVSLSGSADTLFNLWSGTQARGQYLVSVTRGGASVATRTLVIVASSSSSASYVYKVLDASYLTVGVSGTNVTVTGAAGQSVDAIAIPLAIQGN